VDFSDATLFVAMNAMNEPSAPTHHRQRGFANNDPSVVIGNFPWYEMVWRNTRGDFKPLAPPENGYAAFGKTWSQPVNRALISQRHLAPVVTWLGHVSMLLQVGGLNVLIDPTLAGFAGPYGRFGAPRMVPAPLDGSELPPIDVLLISHNHYDHLCDATIRKMFTSGQRPRVFVPLGLKAWFDARGIPNVQELDWWNNADIATDAAGQSLPQAVRIHFTPSQHWSRRTPFDTNLSLWGGYMVEHKPDTSDAWRFFFPGDTGYCADFKAIRQRLGKVDFLALPIGAYLPRDFMKRQHVNPDDAVRLMLDLEARQAMGVHWGTFQLTQETFDQPPRDLALALQKYALATDKVWLLRHGESRHIPI
jgi:N-acyl-phosphatidylethanolamine-hydrolysing phospholipase D